MAISDCETHYATGQESQANLNLTAVNPRLHELSARELRTGIDRLLLQMAENNAASHRAIGRQFALGLPCKHGETE